MPEYSITLSLNGQPHRILTLTTMPRDWYVEEKEVKEDLFSGKRTWEIIFNQHFPNYEYAQTLFLGRLHMAALERNEDSVKEEQERRMYPSSPVGRL